MAMISFLVFFWIIIRGSFLIVRVASLRLSITGKVTPTSILSFIPFNLSIWVYFI